MPVDKVGDFIEMAATLIEIKSKKLLPPPPEEDDEEEEDPEKKLIRQLEEYKLFKEQSQVLSNLEDVDSLYKDPEPLANGYRYELKDFSFDKLLDAFALIMHKVQERAEVPEAKPDENGIILPVEYEGLIINADDNGYYYEVGVVEGTERIYCNFFGGKDEAGTMIIDFWYDKYTAHYIPLVVEPKK
jgi:segregation and condensation protein A